MRLSKIFKILAGTFFIFLLIGCDGSNDEKVVSFDAETGKTTSNLYTLPSTLWPEGRIPVCWENPTSANATQRDWVASRVKSEWEQAGINFMTWGTCSSDADGIRIRIAENETTVPGSGYGTHIDGVENGLTLNFNWEGCGSSRECIEGIAVHQFGHALGFTHHPDCPSPPSSCLAEALSPNEIESEGGRDSDSIMNYCNPYSFLEENLSPADIHAARYYYPGNVNMRRIRDDGRVGAYIDLLPWSNGWTTAKVFTVGTAKYLFLLKASTGDVHIHQMNSDGTRGAVVVNTQWDRGWTSADFFEAGGDTYLFLLKRGNGVVNVKKMNSDGTVGSIVDARDWSRGWTSAKTFVADNQPFLFLLKSGTGDVHIHQLDASGQVGAKVFDKKWSRGWDTAEFFTNGSSTFLFLMKSGNGVVHIQNMNSDGTVGSRADTDGWSRLWDGAEFYRIEDQTYMIIMKTTTGDVHFHEVNDDGTVGARIVDEVWRKGWTSIDAYEVDGNPYLFLLQETFQDAPGR